MGRELLIRLVKENKYVIPCFIFFLNFLIKLLYISEQDLSHDEPFTIYHAQFDISSIVSQLKGYNNPPLYELILHFVIKFFGISPLSVRFLPALFGSLAAVMIFLFGKKYFSAWTGTFGALLFSFSTMGVYFSHDCRVYTLFLLLTLISMFFYMKLLNGQASFIDKTLFMISNVLIIYAHYFGFMVLFIQCLHLLWARRDAITTFLLPYLIMMVCYIPQISILAQRFSESGKGTWLPRPAGIENLYYMLWSFSNIPVITVCCIMTLLTAALLFSKKKERKISADILLLFIWFAVPYFGMFVLSEKIPMYLDRYLIFTLPAYYLLIALSVDRIISEKKLKLAAGMAFVLGFAFTMNPDPGKKREIAATINFIKEHKDRTTLVLVCNSDFLPSFAYYYNISYFKNVSDNREYYLARQALQEEHIYHINTAADLGAHINAGKTLIYFDAGNDSRSNIKILESLKQKFSLTDQVHFDDIFNVYIFAPG